MEGLQAVFHPPVVKYEPDTENIKRKLIQKGVYPTPKIIHTRRKKEIQKHNRKLKRLAEQDNHVPRLTRSQKQELLDEYKFQTLKSEYKEFSKAIEAKVGKKAEAMMVGRPWDGLEKVEFLELAGTNGEYGGEKLRKESLKELKEMFEARKLDELRWVLDDDIEMNEDWFNDENESRGAGRKTRKRSEAEVIRFLVARLSAKEITGNDWKFARMMKLSGLQFTEGQLLKILEELSAKGSWKQALSVVNWVYKKNDNRNYKSRFVYTKLLAVLGRARRPKEALQIFNLMRGDLHIYPDIAAYHSIAVTLGQAGLLKELLKVVECMRQKPNTRFMNRKDWDPILEPDVVIYNAILNACVSSKQWEGVSWVFKQLRKGGLKPNGATYGLAMEVMLQSGKYDLVHELFRKMIKSREATKSLTYKVLVKTFWKEGKVDGAVEAVRDMERRGVIGTASVYYELACCLCNFGRWQNAMLEVEKIKRLSHARPLEVTFTGMIMASLDGGHVDDCICIFEHMREHCAPNIGTINAMLKVYGRSDMFSKAKELFEEVKGAKSYCYGSPGDGGEPSIVPDEYTYSSMLEASACALQWEYFEHVYKEMTLSGYQLDQNKHASLLVEASKAGKGHLLEHAFDVILESGEIPPPLFFMDLVVQATAYHNYERAAVLVTTMAYAPFQVSEKQWTDLFKENQGRINLEKLDLLLDALSKCDVAYEATVSNLSRSLHSLCGIDTRRNVSGTIGFGSENTLRDQNCRTDNGRTANVPINSETMDGSAESISDIVCSSHVEPNIISPHDDHVNSDDDDIAIVSRPKNYDIADRTSLFTDRQGFADDVEFDKYFDTLCENWDVSNGSTEEDDTASERPSAHEILQEWKKRRNDDKSYSQSQIRST
ncbi:pentatricopeptide repeat-containing protein At5g67570, chloroplastic [Prosopis cineraria]|uniref:pentatricopeptide repeat-containing protein At5g67570, chloroplastic n=1 Tax=Prosopis cineraria TaxID=364024 RepID=UPI00240EB465|nr:pentatricopeptide repeat-containing protein At5g67570, chloroplastic [Prosopis cineraria]